MTVVLVVYAAALTGVCLYALRMVQRANTGWRRALLKWQASQQREAELWAAVARLAVRDVVNARRSPPWERAEP